MSDALLAVERQNDKCHINFIYEELRDFTVTQKISNSSVAEAIHLIVGFYPIRITQNGNVFSVECTQKEIYKVTGQIIDENARPLSYASIELLNPYDSAFINSGVSNSNGDVVIPCSKGDVLARISYVGHKTIYKPCHNGVLGIIKMAEDVIALKEVKVKARKPIVKAEKGVLTYNMPIFLQEMPSENAYEALTRIPGVMEDLGGLSFAGSHATLIINGKPTTLPEKQIVEMLKAMPSEMLSCVEVVPSAPARYHTQGMSINVITKDNLGINKLSGQLQSILQQSKYRIEQGKGNIIYSNDHFAIDALYEYTNGRYYSEAEHKAEHPHIMYRKHYEDFVQNITDITKHELRIGADYAFTDKHRLSAAYTGTWQENNVVNITKGTIPTIQQGEVDYHIHNVDVNYQLPFGLRLSTSYMSYKNPRAQILGENMQEIAYSLSTNSNQGISKWIATADQEHKFKNNWGISYGTKMQITNNISYQKLYDVMGMEIPERTSKVNYQEYIVSPYTSVSKMFDKHLSIDAFISAEQYKTPKWNEWRILPSVMATWNVDDNNLLNMSFHSGAIYPSYWSTMNTVYFASAYKEIWGNPDLKPYSNYELNLMWQFKQKYSLMFFAKFNPDYAVQLPYQPKDTMAVVFQEKNLDFSKILGLQVSTMFSAGKWLTGNVTLAGYYQRDKSSNFFDLSFDREGFTYMLTSTISARLLSNHNLQLLLNPYFQSNAIQGVYNIAPILMLKAQLHWQSDNKRWSLVLAGENLTNSFLNAKSVCDNQNFQIKTNKNYRTVSLTATLKFGNYKAKKNKEIDISRMGY